MAKIRDHKELRVWQDAMDGAMRVFQVTKRFPSEERYSLVDQVRRCSRSVAANIAEAWRKRRYEAAFVAKINDAECEAGEAQTWIELSRRCGYLADEQAAELDTMYERIIGQLVVMARGSRDWVIDARKDKQA